MKVILIVIMFLLFPFIYAQEAELLDVHGTAAELEAMMRVSTVNCGQAAMFVLNSTDINFGGSAATEVTSATKDAFEYASSKGWLKNKQPDDPITLSQLSFLVMKAFDINGIMMYRLLPCPRYAYRTMVSRSFIQGNADPEMMLNGERFLHILGRVLNAAGGEE